MATSEPGRPDGPRRLGLAHCGTPRTESRRGLPPCRRRPIPLRAPDPGLIRTSSPCSRWGTAWCAAWKTRRTAPSASAIPPTARWRSREACRRGPASRSARTSTYCPWARPRAEPARDRDPADLHVLVAYPEEPQDLEAFLTNELIDDCNSYDKERIRRWRASGNGAEGGLPRPGRKNLGGGGRSDIMDRVHWMLGGFVYT